jgi:hypothetical protein
MNSPITIDKISTKKYSSGNSLQIKAFSSFQKATFAPIRHHTVSFFMASYYDGSVESFFNSAST